MGPSLLRPIAVALILAASPVAAHGGGAAPCQGQRALVLGGGGVTGYAWEIGLLKGLHDAGTDLAGADLVVGTSAGALLAAQLASGQSLDDLYETIRTPRRGGQGSAPSVDLAYLLDTFSLWQDADPSVEQRTEVGRRALEATDAVSEEDQIAFVARNFGVAEWPLRPLIVTATDTADGAPRLFDASQGVPIGQALAASIALPVLAAPIAIDGHRYMDGGVSGSTHLDAADGYACVVGITPGGGSLADREVEALEAQGTQVLRVIPDADSTAARGFNIADQARAPGSAEAGLLQAESVAFAAARFWDAIAMAQTPTATAVVQIDSLPAAAILVDGQPAGQTPGQLSLSPGDHQIRLAAPTYADWAFHVLVSGGETVSIPTVDLAPLSPADIVSRSVSGSALGRDPYVDASDIVRLGISASAFLTADDVNAVVYIRPETYGIRDVPVDVVMRWERTGGLPPVDIKGHLDIHQDWDETFIRGCAPASALDPDGSGQPLTMTVLVDGMPLQGFAFRIDPGGAVGQTDCYRADLPRR